MAVSLTNSPHFPLHFIVQRRWFCAANCRMFQLFNLMLLPELEPHDNVCSSFCHNFQTFAGTLKKVTNEHIQLANLCSWLHKLRRSTDRNRIEIGCSETEGNWEHSLCLILPPTVFLCPNTKFARTRSKIDTILYNCKYLFYFHSTFYN